MCGFFGFYNSNLNIEEKVNISKKAIKILHNRGPDHNDTWVDSEKNLIFSFNRLSILDLSTKGNQPMHSHTERFTIIFNGEIYNHSELREEINDKHNFNKWNGNSDTETLLACVEFFGVEECLKKINGMFAFVLWDNKEKTIYLARDRFGEKPLYYGWIKENKSFVFSSELIFDKLFKDINFKINQSAIKELFYLNYINGNHSILQEIFKVPPASYLTVKFTDNNKPFVNSTLYWDLSKESSEKKLIFEDDAYVIKKFDDLLTSAVKKQLIADVEVGTFLSGGLDSSLITAKAQEISSKKLTSFTIGSEHKNYDESVYADEVAKCLGVNHQKLIINDKTILDQIPSILSTLNEPLGDSSFIPTFLISKIASSKIKVALTGDAGDELFGGYNRYTKISKLKYIYKIPRFLREFTSKFFLNSNHNRVNFLNNFSRYLPFVKNEYYLDDKIKKMLNKLSQHRSYEEFLLSFSLNNINTEIFLDPRTNEENKIMLYFLDLMNSDKLERLTNEEKMMLIDKKNYLPNDILAKVDRASMANSLETRIPFLDKNLHDFSIKLPMKYKIRNGKGKYLLRQLLKNKIPKHLIERPKAGFAIPIGSWIKKPLLDWSENLFNKKNIEISGLLNFENISKIWLDHKKGIDSSAFIWSVLVFQNWIVNRKL
jgi:asparagine synthase (glutamine-hydrolysing)